MNNELAHYGILGMKWGVRRARIKAAKQARKKRIGKALEELGDDNRTPQKTSKYEQQRKKAYNQYRRDKKNKSKDLEYANKLYSNRTSEANKRALNTSTGKAVVQTSLFGPLGSVVYTSMRGEGYSRGASAALAAVSSIADMSVGGFAGMYEYGTNIAGRSKFKSKI